MTRRGAARYAVLATSAVVALAVGSSLLFERDRPPLRSSVAGSQIVREETRDGNRLLAAIDNAKRGTRDERTAEAPSVADVLVFFDVLLHGPRPELQPEPTVGEVLVFFQALLAEPGATGGQPSVADTLVFFHALLYGGESTAAPPPAPAPVPASNLAPAPRPQPAATPMPRAAAPPPPPPPAPAAQTDADVWIDGAFTQAVWNAVNAQRAQHGLAAVANEGRLHVAAADYAVLMAEHRWFSHTSPDGTSFVDRVVAAGFPFTVQLGEVLAMGSHGWPADEVAQAWMDSPPHREQLLNPAYTRAGLECAFSRENGALMVRCAMEFAAG